VKAKVPAGNTEIHSLADLLPVAVRRYPQASVTCQGITLTYEQLWFRSQDWAKELTAAGVTRGTRVGVLLPNGLDFLCALFAVWEVGGTVLPIHIGYPLPALTTVLADMEVETLITNEVHRSDLESYMSSTGIRHLVVVGGALTVIRAQEIAPISERLEVAGLILLTSGSTGRPKGVQLSHGQVLANMSAVQDYMALGPMDRVLIAKPLTHSSTLVAEALLAFQTGASLEVLPIFLPGPALAALRNQNITLFAGVPAMFRILLRYPEFSQVSPEGIRFAISGETVPPELILELQRCCPQARLYIGYGLSEAGPRVSVLLPHEVAQRPQSVGRAIAGVEVWIVDRLGRRLPPGRRGEIVLRSPSVMMGYTGKAAPTAPIVNGVLRTGDLGYQDADGYLYVVGRTDDMITRGGHNVYPREVESVLLMHPGVEDAMVYGQYGKYGEQEIHALVVPRSGAALTERAVLDHCSRYLATYQRPVKLALVQELPKNLLGKRQRPRPSGPPPDQRL